jgi:hypothetical protein
VRLRKVDRQQPSLPGVVAEGHQTDHQGKHGEIIKFDKTELPLSSLSGCFRRTHFNNHGVNCLCRRPVPEGQAGIALTYEAPLKVIYKQVLVFCLYFKC